MCGLDPTEKRGRVLFVLVWLLSPTLQPSRSIRHHKMAARPPFSRPSGTHRARVSAPPLYRLCSQTRRGPRRGYCEERSCRPLAESVLTLRLCPALSVAPGAQSCEHQTPADPQAAALHGGKCRQSRGTSSLSPFSHQGPAVYPGSS